MTMMHWHYFLSIERDFIRTINFVELVGANAGAFSNEYAKILLLCGSEVDVVAKLLCKKHAPSRKSKNIDDYRKIITAHFTDLHQVTIDIARYHMQVRPWSSWHPAVASSPEWWTAYNDVKHERDVHFAKANQANATEALCGLLAMLLYFHANDGHPQPFPKLLDHGFPAYLVTQGSRELPGVP